MTGSRDNTGKRKVAGAKSDVIREVPLACADEAAAVEFLEKRRWGDTPCCPRCGSVDVYRMRDATTGGRNKHFRWRCRDCKRMHTVRTGTVMEDSRIPLRCWCYAFWAACASKKGVSAKQIQRQTGLSYKSALFLMHRVRFAMTDDRPDPPKLTGEVEMDETYITPKPRYPLGHPKRTRYKMTQAAIMAAVKRGGEVRAKVPPSVTSENVRTMIDEHLAPGAVLHTDGLYLYRFHAPDYTVHLTVEHTAGEYARRHGSLNAHVNTAESFFSLFKRKLHGTHHAVSTEHLHRYVGEACFMWNTRAMEDGERLTEALKRAEGKRLTYEEPVREAG